MIIKNNLASTPVKNYSLFFLGCLILTIFTIGFAVFNISSLSRSFAESKRLQERITEQQRKKLGLQQGASKIRAEIAQIKTPKFVAETEFINGAIKRRIFSWTQLFNEFETALPNNVKMVSVFPSINVKEEEVRINMEVAGRGLNDILDLIKVLENSPVFSDVFFKSERQDADGLLYATISLQYLPEQVKTTPEAVRKQEVPEVEEE